MEIYLFAALMTCVLGFGAVRFRARSKLASIAALALIVVVFCYLAGARDITVGTDTSYYGQMSFLRARNASFYDFFFRSIYASWAPLAKVTLWVAANIWKDFFWYLAVIQFVAIVPLIWASYRFCGRSFPLAVTIYALVFFPMTLNLMRQFMALGFLLTAYVWLDRKNIPVFLLFILVATGFHTTALLGILIWPLAHLAGSKLFSLPIKLLLLSCGMALVFLFADRALQFAADVMGGTYDSYINGITAKAGGGTRSIVFLFGIFSMGGLISYLLIRPGEMAGDEKERVESMALTVLLGIFFWSFGLVSFYLYRMGLNFLYFCVLLVPLLVNCVPGRSERRFLSIVFVIMFVAFFYDYYVIQAANDAIPYLFSSAGILA